MTDMSRRIIVTAAKAGVQAVKRSTLPPWIPAFAGMTINLAWIARF
jgi:hypothetical protein